MHYYRKEVVAGCLVSSARPVGRYFGMTPSVLVRAAVVETEQAGQGVFEALLVKPVQ